MEKNDGARWLYLFSGTLVLIFLGLIYAWSLFRAPFNALFPSWSVSQMSATFAVSIIFFCLGGFVGGALGGKFSVKIRLLGAAACLFVGFFMTSLLDASDASSSLIRLYIFYGVFGGFGVGVGYNAIITTVTKWFPDKVGLASGVMLMGFGFGGMALGSVVNALIASRGVFMTFRVLAITSAVVLAGGVAILKEPASSATETASKASKEDCGRDYSPTETARTARFWIFFAWTLAINVAGLMVINSAANISVAFGGSAILGMIISLFNGAGRIVAGNNFDRFGRRLSTFVNSAFMLTAGVLLVIGGHIGSLALVITGLVFVGASYGGTPTLTSAYINKEFGAKYFPTNFSMCNFSLIPAAVIGPIISARLLEKAKGAYTTNFYAVTVFAAIALILWLFLSGAEEKRRRQIK